MHSKLLDRFTANEDLLAYVQTPAGRRFLEAGPIAVDSPRALSAPVGRILWSVQAGVVLLLGCLGLFFAGRQVVEEVRPPLVVIASLAMALGAGFVISALAAYLIAKRLGLVTPPGAPNGDTASLSS